MKRTLQVLFSMMLVMIVVFIAQAKDSLIQIIPQNSEQQALFETIKQQYQPQINTLNIELKKENKNLDVLLKNSNSADVDIVKTRQQIKTIEKQLNSIDMQIWQEVQGKI